MPDETAYFQHVPSSTAIQGCLMMSSMLKKHCCKLRQDSLSLEGTPVTVNTASALSVVQTAKQTCTAYVSHDLKLRRSLMLGHIGSHPLEVNAQHVRSFSCLALRWRPSHVHSLSQSMPGLCAHKLIGVCMLIYLVGVLHSIQYCCSLVT